MAWPTYVDGELFPVPSHALAQKHSRELAYLRVAAASKKSQKLRDDVPAQGPRLQGLFSKLANLWRPQIGCGGMNETWIEGGGGPGCPSRGTIAGAPRGSDSFFRL